MVKGKLGLAQQAAPRAVLALGDERKAQPRPEEARASPAAARTARRVPRALVFAVALFHGFTIAAAAQTTASSDIYRWLAPDAAAQAAAATIPIPPGAGAILAPSLSGRTASRRCWCSAATSRSRAVPTAPGSSSSREPISRGWEAGRCPRWCPSPSTSRKVQRPWFPCGGADCALRSSTREPAASWRLRADPGRGPPTLHGRLGADTLQGERLLTLLMAPGLYRIVQSGSTYRPARISRPCWYRRAGSCTTGWSSIPPVASSGAPGW